MQAFFGEMNILLEIKNWLIRTFMVLIGFLYFTISSISVSGNPTNLGYDYHSYSAIDLKITGKTNTSTSQNIKNPATAEHFLGVEYVVSITVERAAAKGGVNVVEQVAVHGNLLLSTKPTWGYKLFSQDGMFLKNGITSAVKAESRYTKAFMSDKVMLEKTLFPSRAAAYQWEFGQNQILRGPLNFNMH